MLSQQKFYATRVALVFTKFNFLDTLTLSCSFLNLMKAYINFWLIKQKVYKKFSE